MADLEKAVKAANAEYNAIRWQMENEARAAADAIRDAWKERIDAARKVVIDAERALREHIDATSTHEWEGKKVVRQKNEGRSYSPRYVTIHGVVEVRRSDTQFPPNTASYSMPRHGEEFVRLLKKDGTPGLRFETMRGQYHGWKLAESEPPSEHLPDRTVG